MKDRIEEQLHQDIRESTPDMLDTLLAECGLANEAPVSEKEAVVPAPDQIPRREKFTRRRWLVLAPFAAAAAALLLIFGLAPRLAAPKDTGTQVAVAPTPTEAPTPTATPTPEPTPVAPSILATVTLDVNPSVELSLDADDRVVSHRAINDDAVSLLADLDLTGSDARTASYALIGAMLANGYLTEDTNSVLLSVRALDQARGRALEERLTTELGGLLENATVSLALFGQYLEEDESIEAFAKANGISYGKAYLIQALLKQNATYTEEQLLSLTTQELMLLRERRLPPEEENTSTTTVGTVSTSRYITPEEALGYALARAGLSNSQVTLIYAEFDVDRGVITYDVEFHDGSTKYEAEVDARTGEIYEWETERYYAPSGNQGNQTPAGTPQPGYDDDDDDLDDYYESVYGDDWDDRYDRDDDWDDRYDRDDDWDDRYDRDDDRDDDDD